MTSYVGGKRATFGMNLTDLNSFVQDNYIITSLHNLV